MVLVRSRAEQTTKRSDDEGPSSEFNTSTANARRRRSSGVTSAPTASILVHANSDVLGQVLAVLCDPLSPWDALAFSSTCQSIRRITELQARLSCMREQHLSIVKLCSKVGLDWKLLTETPQLFWACQSIDDSDCATIAMLCARDALVGLFRLTLDDNNIGDLGIATLANALSHHKHGFERLAVLGLSKNNIGDAGMLSLACAYASGALSKLAVFGLAQNVFSDAGIRSFIAAAASGCGSSLEALDLAGNSIGNEGLSAIANAITCGGFEKLTWLNLLQNRCIDEHGMHVLTQLAQQGLMTHIKRLWIDRPDEHPELLAACNACGIHVNGRNINGQPDALP